MSSVVVDKERFNVFITPERASRNQLWLEESYRQICCRFIPSRHRALYLGRLPRWCSDQIGLLPGGGSPCRINTLLQRDCIPDWVIQGVLILWLSHYVEFLQREESTARATVEQTISWLEKVTSQITPRAEDRYDLKQWTTLWS